MKTKKEKNLRFGFCEKYLWRNGYKRILAIDEVGRGALAGPLVLGGVVLDDKFDFKKEQWISLVKDSKKLSPKKREEIFKIAKKHPLIQWKIEKISNKIIDKINILEAFKLGVRRLANKFSKNPFRGKKIDFLILDGNVEVNVHFPHKSIVNADDKVFSCSLASIMAKVERDEMMKKVHKQIPQFLFFKNKGYGTKEHFDRIKKRGFSTLHRKSFLKNL